MNPTTRLTLIAFLLFMARGASGPVASLYWRSLGASYVAIGFLDTAVSVTTIGASYLWGHASDRLGRRKVFLVGGLGVLSGTLAAVAAAPGYAYLFPLYVVMAAAQAAYNMAALALMGDWLERRGAASEPGRQNAGRRMGTYRGLASLGFGMMAFVSGTIADRLSLRAPFAVAAGFMTLAGVLALGAREPSVAEEEPETAAAPTTSMANAEPAANAPAAEVPTGSASPGSAWPAPLPLAPLLVAALLWSLVTTPVYAVWANYMVDGLDYTPGQMTRLWALASLSELPLMILAGWLSDRVGRLPMLALGFAAWAGVFTGYLVVPQMPWIVLVQLLRGFAYSAHTATSMTYAAEVRARAERGRISGLYGTAGALGSILGSSVGGALTQFLGFRTLIGTATAVMVAGGVFLGVVAVGHRMRVRRAGMARLEEAPGS